MNERIAINQIKGLVLLALFIILIIYDIAR